MRPIVMADLQLEYETLKAEIDEAIQRVLKSANFIKGPEVTAFEKELSQYLNVTHVVSCANGTDALMIALMTLDLQPGDEVIVPSFTFIATAEVISFLGLKPVFVDANPVTFNIECSEIERKITPRTRAIIPVHLFGLCANMQEIMNIAQKNNLFVIEDVAQALGSHSEMNGKIFKAGTIGHIAATSFFPSKNLACYGDGGAIFTQDETLAKKARIIANHGAEKKYYHQCIGVNSRLDALQAAILRVKLKYLDNFIQLRQQVAQSYYEGLKTIAEIVLPNISPMHTFNQYTLKIENHKRDELQRFLDARQIPSQIYYPLPLHLQPAFKYLNYTQGSLPVCEMLSEKVISLPMHPFLEKEQLSYIIDNIYDFFRKKQALHR